MYCRKCGTAIPDDSVFCQVCGEQISIAENAISKKKSKPLWIIAIIGVFIITGIVVSVILAKEHKKAELHELLMKDWSRVEINGDSVFKVALDFSDDEIDYVFKSYYFDRTIATYKYKILSENTIEVERESGSKQVVSIEFNEEKDMMIFTPSITSLDSSENWFYHTD